MRLGAVLRGWRERNRMGMREAAKTLGVSNATLCRIEGGKPMDAKTLVKILDYLLHEGPLP